MWTLCDRKSLPTFSWQWMNISNVKRDTAQYLTLRSYHFCLQARALRPPENCLWFSSLFHFQIQPEDTTPRCIWKLRSFIGSHSELQSLSLPISLHDKMLIVIDHKNKQTTTVCLFGFTTENENSTFLSDYSTPQQSGFNNVLLLGFELGWFVENLLRQENVNVSVWFLTVRCQWKIRSIAEQREAMTIVRGAVNGRLGGTDWQGNFVYLLLEIEQRKVWTLKKMDSEKS